MQIRALSYNIHKGFKIGNRDYVLDAMRESIRNSRADLVFLQEVHGHRPTETEGHDELHPDQTQFEYLADQVWSHHAYGRNAAYTDGHHGNAILSRFPIQHTENLDLSTNRFERRGLLYARTIDPNSPGTPVHLLCTHLNLMGGSRQKQLQKIQAWVASKIPAGEPIILAGDFNDWRGELAHQLEKNLGLIEVYQKIHGDHARTFPSVFPVLKLDRMHVRGFNVLGASLGTDSSWRTLSDHLGLVAELELVATAGA